MRAIISMAHSLNLDVVAEGVETLAQLSYLRRHHCDQIQGYYFSRPLGAEQVGELLLQGRRLAPPEPCDARRQTLLVVDDDQLMLDMLAELFKDDGYHIEMVRSGADGFDVLARHEVQVILCDQCMPGLDGATFLDQVKAMYPDTVRIVLSGNTDLASMMAAVNSGAIDRFYTKPWDGALLRNNIREAFRRHRLPRGDDALPEAA